MRKKRADDGRSMGTALAFGTPTGEVEVPPARKIRAPRFTAGSGPNTVLPEGPIVEWLESLREATGIQDRDAGAKLLLEASGVRWAIPAELSANMAAGAFADFKPADILEAHLFGELLACHTAGMEFLRRALLPEQPPEGVDTNVTRATKLLRTVTAQAEVLAKLRGKGTSEQRVVVQHVHVSEGGQAIVGNVARTNPGEGGGRT